MVSYNPQIFTVGANIVGLFLMLIPVTIYGLVLRRQYSYLKESTLRLQVLSTRAVISVPIYAFFIYLSFVYPTGLNGFSIPIAIFEGYSFYCFFAMVVGNMGGPDETIKYMSTKPESLCCSRICCSCWCPSDKADFYLRCTRSLWHFVFTRVVIVIVSVILFYCGIQIGFVILEIISFLILVNGILSVINFYEFVMDASSNIYGILKFLVLKVSVGLVVIQGLIVSILISFNRINLPGDGQFSSDDQADRLYLFIILVEYIFVSAAMYVGFSSEMQPSTRNGALDSPTAFNRPTVSFQSFMWSVLQFHDIIGKLDPSSPISSPLHKQGANDSNRA